MNFGAGIMTVVHEAPVSAVLQVVQASGYRGQVVREGDRKIDAPSVWSEPKTRMTAVAGLILTLAFILNNAGVADAWIIPMYVISMIIGGYHVVRIGIFSLKALAPDMNFLMTIAAVGAAAIGEWHEAAVVVFLFSLGNTLQAFSMDRTRRSVRALMELAPPEALVIRDGVEFMLAVEDLAVGDHILIKPGERIPMDGTITRGLSTIDQSSVTGEPMPVERTLGEEVFAGTVNGAGALEVYVTRLSKDNTIGRIMHMVEEAQAQKAPSQQLVDVFARYYTPLVIAAAALVVLIPVVLLNQPFDPWFYKALVLLVISCPCALVISTPVSIVSAIGSASRSGVLIKGGAFLEALGSITTMAFDKTGTLTEGRPVVESVIPAPGYTTSDVLVLAASLERYSEHPIGAAILQSAEEHHLQLQEVTEFMSRPGMGVEGNVKGVHYGVSGPRVLTDFSGGVPPELTLAMEEFHQQGRTVVALYADNRVLGLIAVMDQIRPQAARAIERLRKAGVTHTVMLTGDHMQAARAVAENVGVDEVRAELMPEDKVAAMQDLLQRHGQVAMVGDGVNDAPALALATVGIAMGAAGTDAALETADIALMGDDLEKLEYGVSLSRQTVAIIKQNIVFSVGVKGVFLLLTFLGMANLWMAVFADTGAALVVIINGMRLMRYRT
jgi:Cd2+/Zn2+-exporting ATPase